ncbi:MAG: hypothetical protein ACYDBH_24455 [Acidobacteriaceae bacterium]
MQALAGFVHLLCQRFEPHRRVHQVTQDQLRGVRFTIQEERERFILRGLDNVKGEWDLVAMAWNLKRMYVLRG